MAIGTPADIGNNATTGTAVLSLSITLASGVAAGALILVSIANHNSAAVVPDTVTDSAGNTYAILSAANSSGVTAALAYCVNAAALSAGNTITVTYSSTRHIAMRAYSVSGIATSSAFDVSATNAAGSGTAASVGPTSATSQADELVFASWAYQNSRTLTPGTGYTLGTADETTSTIRGRVAEWKIVAATGAQTADGTWNTSATFAGVVATFKGLSSVAKSATDSASASDASSLAASPSPSDSATASDASSLAASATPTDSATVSDVSAVAAAIATSDSAALTESATAQNLGTAVAGSETPGLSETSALTASASANDSATASETSSVTPGSRSDSATASETSSVTPGSRSDSATASETSSLVVLIATSDGATLGEVALAQLLIVLFPTSALTALVPPDVRSVTPIESLTALVPPDVRSVAPIESLTALVPPDVRSVTA